MVAIRTIGTRLYHREDKTHLRPIRLVTVDAVGHGAYQS